MFILSNKSIKIALGASETPLLDGDGGLQYVNARAPRTAAAGGFMAAMTTVSQSYQISVTTHKVGPVMAW